MKTNICSYCNEVGHYINKCNDPSIDILQNKLYRDAIIDLYCVVKFNYEYLKYCFELMTNAEIRVLLYKNKYPLKIERYPKKLELQKYYEYLINLFSLHNKDSINIPYIENRILWNYATDIYKTIHNNVPSAFSIYKDIIKISPRPYCYEINTELMLISDIKLSYNNEKCSICLENIKNVPVGILNCKHSYCVQCIEQYLESLYRHNKNYYEYFPTCPLCRTHISIIKINENSSFLYLNETFFTEFIPDYFNTISNNEKQIEHNYEKPFYHMIDEDTERDEESEVEGPYYHPVHLPIQLHSPFIVFIKIKDILITIISNLIIPNPNYYIINIIRNWFLFVITINLILKYTDFIIEIFSIIQVDDEEYI